jgi:ABC-2 type transport system permease protein
MNTIFRLVLKMQLSRGRMLALGALGLLPIILAIATRNSSEADPATSMFDVIDHLGLGVLAPVTALVFASAALGDLAEDRTLVYLWLRPVDRWRIALGALGACLCTTLPFVLVPLTIAVLVSGFAGSLLGPTLLSTSIAVLGYAALFLGLGLRVRRALVWGLAYVVVWEGAVARAARGAARLSVQVYARSILAHLADHLPPKQAASTVVSVIVPLVVVVIAYAVTTRWLRTADVY